MTRRDDPYGGDILLEDCIERALAPHKAHLSKEDLVELRDELLVFIATHPAAEPLYARLRERPALQKSTLVEKMRHAEARGAGTAQGISSKGKRK